MKKVLVTFIILVLSGCGNLFFYPEKRHFLNLNLLNYSHTDVYFDSIDGVKLHGWLFKSKLNKGTIVFFHGNAENISTHIDSMFWLLEEGYNIFAIDYRGYGKSEGKPTIEGLINDAISAIYYIQSINELNKDIIIYGQSIGGAIAVTAVANVSEKKSLKALIIESSFSSYKKIAKDKIKSHFLLKLFYPLVWFIDDKYSPEYFIGKVSPIPVMIMHGKLDEIVPYYHSLRLFEHSKEPKKLIIDEESRHINLWHYDHIRKEILMFLENHK